MDLYRIIGELVQERARILRIIESLEEMGGAGHKAAPVRHRKARGRKSMDSNARKEVSERMRRYWAKRRGEKGVGDG